MEEEGQGGGAGGRGRGRGRGRNRRGEEGLTKIHSEVCVERPTIPVIFY